MPQSFTPRPLVIAPSILASDFSRLGDEVRAVRRSLAIVPDLLVGGEVVGDVRMRTGEAGLHFRVAA